MSSVPQRSRSEQSSAPENSIPPRSVWSNLRERITALSSFYRPMTGILTRPALLMPVLFLLAVSWFNIGQDYGISKQVFHENHWLQWVIGLGASGVLLQVCLVAFLLDARKRWLRELPDRPGSLGRRIDRQMRWYLDFTWLPLLALLTGRVGYDLLCWLDFTRWLPMVDLISDSGRPSPWNRLPFALGALFPLLIYFPIRFLRRNREEPLPIETRQLTLYAPEEESHSSFPTFTLREIACHLMLASVGFSIVWLVIPSHRLEWLTFALTTWLSLHGFILFRYRVPSRKEDRDAYRLHHRAGVIVGSVIVAYQVLFTLFCLDLWYVPPALITFMMLYLFVTIHGFLAYHFRGWYFAAIVGLLGLIALINGELIGARAFYPLRFYGLYYDQPAELIEVDFEGLYAKLLKRTSDLEQDPDNQEKFDRVIASLHRLVEAHRGLALRWRTRLEQAGKIGPIESLENSLPGVEVTSQALAERRYAEVYATYRRWRKTTDELGATLASLEYDNLEQWARQAAPNGEKPKLVIVAVSGGANRSALWTTFVLDQLERAFAEQQIVLPRHIRLVTGASGGMVGASYWVSTLDEPQSHTRADPDEFVDRIATDCLTRLTNHALFLDLPSLLLPGPFDTDRGVALEQAWKENLNGALDRSIRSLAPGEVQGWRPSLVFSPMLVEDGRRLIISNLYLPFLTETAGQSLVDPDARAARPGARHERTPRPAGKPIKFDPDLSEDELARLPRDRYSVSAIEFFQLFPRADQFKLSTAVRMSATFPYFSPAVDLPTEPRRRVVDAGYYDNFGVDVAASWLYHYRRWILRNTSGVVLIQIRDSVSERSKLFPDERQPMWKYSRALEWATGPLVGVGNARVASMSFRNDEKVQMLSDFFNREGKPMFTTVVFEAPGDVAMSWYLTREEIERMKTGFSGQDSLSQFNRQAVQRLLAWWRKDHSRMEQRVDRQRR